MDVRISIPDVAFDHSCSNNVEFEMINLRSIKQRCEHHLDPEKPHKVSFFHIIYFAQGSGKHMIDFEYYAFSAGSFIFVQSEPVHAFDFSNDPAGQVFIFTAQFLERVHANMRLPIYTPTHFNHDYSPLVLLSTDKMQRCEAMFEQIAKEIEGHCDELVVMYLFSALSLILERERPRLSHQELSGEQGNKLAQLYQLLRENINRIRDAHWYAANVHTTYKTLNTICKLATGLTAKQLVDAFAILEIKRLLVVNRSSTQQIALSFGFDDVSNFTKFFKKHAKQTPTQFLRQFVKEDINLKSK